MVNRLDGNCGTRLSVEDAEGLDMEVDESDIEDHNVGQVICESHYNPLGANEMLEFNRRVPKLHLRDGLVDFASRLKEL